MNKAALFMLIAPLITGTWAFSCVAQASAGHGWLAAVLLVLPSALICLSAIGLLTIHGQPELLTLGITVSDIVKNLLVGVYVYCSRGVSAVDLKVFSWLSLSIACALVIGVYGMVSWIMNTQTESPQTLVARRQWQRGVIDQLLQHRFISICGLLIAYLHLLLFLSLALAFHDRAAGGGSIERQVRRRDLPPADTAPSPVAAASAPVTLGRVRTFAFPMGSTSLRCTAAASERHLDRDFFEERYTNGWRIERLQAADLAAGACAKDLRETAWNIAELHGLKADLSALYANGPFERYRLAIVAHATDHKANPGFSSNYEMSRARAEQAQALIETLLAKLRDEDKERPPLNVEWQITPSGTADIYVTTAEAPDAQRLEAAGLERPLTAEVQLTRIPEHLTALQRESLEPRKGKGGASELQLLDYFYFMTSMGSANDLAPASGFVQFVASAGQIAQVFLLVIVINVILAFRKPRLEGEE
ncbi:MAG TPA: hypothetical protein VGF69_17225 [Thermoanaerobaculia bacterium]